MFLFLKSFKKEIVGNKQIAYFKRNLNDFIFRKKFLVIELNAL